MTAAAVPAPPRDRGRHSIGGNAAALPPLFVLAAVFLYPLLLEVSGAFSTNAAYPNGASPLPAIWSLGAFPRAWSEANFAGYFLNTFWYAGISTVFILIKSALCGYVLARYEFPGRGLLRWLIVITLFVPPTAFFIPQFLLVNGMGWLDTYQGVLLIFATAAQSLFVLLFEGFFLTVPKELYEAARVDGAGFLRTFWTIVPLSRPVVAVVVIFSVSGIWNDFFTPLLYSFTNPTTWPIAIGMTQFNGEYGTDVTGIAAGMMMSILPVVGVFLFFQRYFVRGLAGSVKG